MSMNQDAMVGSSLAVSSLAVSSLGPVEKTSHHALALDSDGDGFWNRFDRITIAVADRLNPILIKETRESLKSRQFLITFFLLLALTLLWTCLGIIFNAPEVYYLPTGASLLSGYYFLLAVPIFGLVPLIALRSLSGEIDNDTFELMSITELASGQIVRGKFASAVLQMVLYLAAVVPSLAFSYLLRGVSLTEIAMVLIAVFMAGLVLTSIALMMAPLVSGYLGQALAIVGLITIILFVQSMMAGICLSEIVGTGVASTRDGWLVTLITSINLLVFVKVFLRSAAAGIAPVSENRSTSLRYWTLVQQSLWIVTIVSLSIYYDEFEWINFGSFILATYWLVIGTIALTESTEISPRVRRELPSTILGRAFFSALMPGPSSGYLFAVCSGSVAIVGFGWFGTLFGTKHSGTEPILFSLVMIGYLMTYLGLVRLLTLPLAKYRMLPLLVAFLTLAAMLVLSGVAPSAISVVIEGDLQAVYTELEILDPFWTLVKAFEHNGLPIHLTVLPLASGIAFTFINLFYMKDLYKYRKIAIPDRVLVDREPLSLTQQHFKKVL